MKYLETWIIFVVIYSILKGTREPIKKNILKECNVFSTLFVYTAIGFLLAVPTARGILDVPPQMFFWIVVKCTSIFVAWALAFLSIKKVPVSIYGLTDTSRVIFSTLMGVFFLGESLTVKGVIGLLLVVSGLYVANRQKKSTNEVYRMKYIWMIILSCALNGVSGTLDKYIMSKGTVTESALQFWFMLILAVMYLLYILIKREKLELKKCLSNPWIYVLSLSLVVGDRVLFAANADPNSRVTIMTLIKQSSAVVTIILGKFLYKEQHIVKKLLCACVIIAGIMIAVI